MKDRNLASHTLTPSRRTCPTRHWRRGIRCLRALIRDPYATANAVELVQALDPDRPRRCIRRLEMCYEGRRLLREQPRLLNRLVDRNRLAALPDGTLGRAYLDHIDRYSLDPRGLVELYRQIAPNWEAIPADERRWIERSVLMHDLWHVLTGCGADPTGEATLLPFSWAQLPGWANAFLTLGVGLRGLRPSLGRSTCSGMRWLVHLGRSWSAGRRASWLGAFAYEELLAMPLSEVRALAGITPLDAPGSSPWLPLEPESAARG